MRSMAAPPRVTLFSRRQCMPWLISPGRTLTTCRRYRHRCATYDKIAFDSRDIYHGADAAGEHIVAASASRRCVKLPLPISSRYDKPHFHDYASFLLLWLQQSFVIDA